MKLGLPQRTRRNQSRTLSIGFCDILSSISSCLRFHRPTGISALGARWDREAFEYADSVTEGSKRSATLCISLLRCPLALPEHY